MKRLILTVFLAVTILLGMADPAWGQTASCAASSAVLKNSCVNEDTRAEILRTFLKKYNSPLVSYSEEFVTAADAYGIDWKLVPAITGVESTFGKQIPFGSYNAYGWNNGEWKFKSWKDSIWYVTGQLKTRYINQGAISVSQIGRIYAPPSPFWAGRVNHFMNEIKDASSFTLDL